MADDTRSRPLLGPIATAFLYFVLAAASLFWTRGGVQIATMWPAGGLAVAVLASVDRAHLWRYAIAVVVGSLGANIACGTPFWTGSFYTVANVVETLLAIHLLSRCPFGQPSFVDVRQVGCFCAIAAIACGVSTVIASAGTTWTDWRFAVSWFATDLLGIVLTAPLAFLLAQQRRDDPTASVEWPQRRTLALALGGVAVVSVLVFFQSWLPILFLPFAALMAATYATGPLGAAAGTLVVALVGSAAINLGYGPTALIHEGSGAQAFFLQSYLVVLMGCALSMAALQTARTMLFAVLRERTRLLFMAERVAKVGHWHLELRSGEVAWSEEVFRLYGLNGNDEPSLERALAAYHEDDRERLTEAVANSTRTGQGFRLRARIVRPDGDVRHADVSAEAVLVDGTVRSLFGIVQDITEYVETERNLEASREEALVLAETDALTALPNRRRILHAIDAALQEAALSGAPLSVAMFDIDHFKKVNDVHGHAAGDAVLRRVAASAKGAVRRSDLVGRLGGEEFIVLLPSADQAVAMEIAERIRRDIETGGTDGPTDPKVTTSVGVAIFAGEENVAALIHRADLALYQAKSEGRNASRLAA